jgi:hypothetical protein
VARTTILAAATPATAVSPTVATAESTTTAATPTESAAAATTAAESTTPAAATPAESTATTATFTGRTVLAGPGDVHGQGASPEVLALEHFHGALGFLRGREFDEGKSAGPTRELVEHEVDVQHYPSGREVVLDVALHRLVGQVAHEETILIFHNTNAASNTAWDPAPGQDSD